MDPMCSFYVQTHLHDPKPEHQLKTAAPHTPGMVYSLNEGQKRFLRFGECTCDCDCCCCSLWLPALTLVHCLSLALAFSLSPFIPVHVCMGASMYLCIPKPVRESKVHKVRESEMRKRAQEPGDNSNARFTCHHHHHPFWQSERMKRERRVLLLLYCCWCCCCAFTSAESQDIKCDFRFCHLTHTDKVENFWASFRSSLRTNLRDEPNKKKWN